MKLWYLASPYTYYKSGLDIAYRDVCELTGKLIRAHNLRIFSPISHGHGLSKFGGLPYTDHEFWKELDRAFVHVCDGLLVAKMDGWDESFGIAHEISEFRAASKPIQYVDPVSLEISF